MSAQIPCPRHVHVLAALCLVLLLAIAAGCTGVAPAAPGPAPVAQAPAAASPAVSSPEPPPTAVPTYTPVPPTNTPVPPTTTPIPPTNTPVPTPTAVPPTFTPTVIPPTPTATAIPASPTPDKPQVTVKSASINVRAGPGADFPVIGQAKVGQSFEITGRDAEAAWLQVCCLAGKPGWVSAGLVTITGDVAALPVPKEIPTRAPAPTAVPTTAAQKPPAAGGPLSGTLLYSVFNRPEERWELWQYTFANGEAKFLKEWRTEAAFAPNFQQLCYYGWEEGLGQGKEGIYVSNPDLSGERLLIPGGAYPSFSPDGNRLTVQGGPKFWIINSDGSGLHPIDTGEYPTWSPVDNWIAHRGCYGPDCGLWLTHADSGERRRLTTGGGDGQPAWSPNGQVLAYISKDDGNFEIYRINRDGANGARLTSEPHSDGLPIWSPDGSWIAFRSDRDGKWAIYVMRGDGSGLRKIVDADVLPLWFFEKMAWRP